MGAITLTVMLGAPLALLAVSVPVAATDPVYDGHHWNGAYYSGDPTTAQLIEADILVPHWLPDAGDSYYVLISVFDSALIYDQIGFSATAILVGATWLGTWQITWSAMTDDCGLEGTFVRNAGLLAAGGLYHFSMEINSNGDVVYTVSRQGTEVFSHTEHTGGTYFRVEDHTTCEGEPWTGYTNYEELYEVQQQAVPYNNFYFRGNKADGTTISSWDPYRIIGDDPTTPDQPLPIKVIGSGSEAGNVGIWNEWFDLRCDDCYNLVLSPDQSISDLEVDLLLNAQGIWGETCITTCDVSVSVISSPSGWDVTISPDEDTPPSTFLLDIDTPSDADGSYQIHLQADQGSDYFTRYQIFVSVWDGGPPADNQGGCVAYGTGILTPGGEVEVEHLDPQDVVIGWDVSLGEPLEVEQTMVANFLEVQGLDINYGALVIPGAGQRLYARTAEGSGFTEGWINNAIDLKLGDFVFNADEGEWVGVISRSPTGPVSMVCDLATSGPNNFVGNGFLLGGYLP